MYTLIKGVTYPIFLAFVKWSGITYGQGMGILIVSSALTMISMLKKVINSKIFLLLAYIYVLFLPIGYATWSGIHIYRDAIFPWLLLILISCLISIFFQRKKSWISSIGWILGVAITFPVICHLREDTIWLYPLVVASMLLSALGHYAKVKWRVLKCLGFVLIPWIVLVGSNVIVSSLNYQKYGIFEVNDRTYGSFSKMMSLIYKVEDDSVNDKVWCTYDMLDKCIKVSPTLQTMEENIRNEYYTWAHVYWDSDLVEGDFTQWVLREAFAKSGYYKDAKTTEKMIASVVNEIEAAYASGDLISDHKIHISSQGRGMKVKELLDFCEPTVVNVWKMPRYAGCQNYYPFYPTCEETLVEEYEKILSQPFSNIIIEESGKKITARIGEILLKIYQKTGMGMFYVGLWGWAMMCFSVLMMKIKGNKKRRSEEGDIIIINVGLMLSGYLLIYMITVFTSFLSETSFYNYTTGYYIILVLFECFMLYFVAKMIKNILKKTLKNR